MRSGKRQALQRCCIAVLGRRKRTRVSLCRGTRTSFFCTIHTAWWCVQKPKVFAYFVTFLSCSPPPFMRVDHATLKCWERYLAVHDAAGSAVWCVAPHRNQSCAHFLCHCLRELILCAGVRAKSVCASIQHASPRLFRDLQQ